MTRLNWTDPLARRFQDGVDQGVFYPKPFGSRGSAWPGLLSVDVKEAGATATPIYMNGYIVAYYNVPSEFAASIEAINIPDAFNNYANGRLKIARGFSAHNQARREFDFVFRTKQGSAASGELDEYILHLVYNAQAIPGGQAYATIADSQDPVSFSWEIVSIPIRDIGGVLPTPYLTLDTREVHPYLMGQIEQILYGNESDDSIPQMVEPELAIEILSQDAPEYFRNYCIDPTFEGVTGWNASTSSTEFVRDSEWASEGFSSGVVRRKNSESMSVGIEMSVPAAKVGAFAVVLVKVHVDERLGTSIPRVRVRTEDGPETYSDQLTGAGTHQVALIHEVGIADKRVFVTLALNWLTGKGATGDVVAFDDVVVAFFDSIEEAEEGRDIVLAMGSYFDGDRDDGKWGHGEWVGARDGSESVYRSFGLPYDNGRMIHGFGLDPFGERPFG